MPYNTHEVLTYNSVEYSSSSIVSRQVIESTAGTVTLFAFDAGQALSEHTAPFDALVHVIEGRLKLTIGGEPVEVPAGTMTVMPADIPHALDAPERTKMVLTMIRGEKEK